MKKTIFILLGSLLAVIGITIILLLLVPSDNIIYDVLKEINKTLIGTVIIGTTSAVISGEIIKIKKDNNKMKQLGIHSIGEGLLDKRQEKLMFGSKYTKYPTELKFCFITGVVFLKTFENNMLESIKNGTDIKILLADPKNSAEFLGRTDFLTKQDKKNNYIDQLNEVLVWLDKMKKEVSENNYSGSIEIRHYIDEYRYNFRLAKFKTKEHEEIKAWINFQPINRDAINQSLTVLGSYNDDYIKDSLSIAQKESESIVLSLDEAFDSLWIKYKK